MAKIKQPDWCDNPDATVPFWGCCSLNARLVKDEDYCKDCDCYRRKENSV